jgi:hypothetical protein
MPDPDQRDHHECTPLHIALLHGACCTLPCCTSAPPSAHCPAARCVLLHIALLLHACTLLHGAPPPALPLKWCDCCHMPACLPVLHHCPHRWSSSLAPWLPLVHSWAQWLPGIKIQPPPSLWVRGSLLTTPAHLSHLPPVPYTHMPPHMHACMQDISFALAFCSSTAATSCSCCSVPITASHPSLPLNKAPAFNSRPLALLLPCTVLLAGCRPAGVSACPGGVWRLSGGGL